MSREKQPLRIKAAVVWDKGCEFSLEEIDLEPPRDHEVLVELRAVGICHTDLLARDGLYPTPHPLVCGHEGAGVVKETGSSVTKVTIGDHVLMTFDSCGECENCLAARRPYCDQMFELNFGGFRADGSSPLSKDGETIHGWFMGQSAFATHAVVEQRAVVHVPHSVPFHVLAPLGCSVQTGAGAIFNALHPTAGTSIVIFGSGGVGLAAVMAARVAGCNPIIAVDLRPERLALAARFGATHTVDAGRLDAVGEVKRLTKGGAQYSLEVTGDPRVLRQAVDCLRETGLCGLVGAAPHGAEASLDWTTLLRGRSVRGIIYGDSIPEVLIPRLVSLQQSGLLPFDELVERFPFEKINTAAAASEDGRVIKPVLEFN